MVEHTMKTCLATDYRNPSTHMCRGQTIHEVRVYIINTNQETIINN